MRRVSDGRLEQEDVYTVRFSRNLPEMRGAWDGPVWGRTAAVSVACARPEGSGHLPKTAVKFLYTPAGIGGIFRVEDRFVRCVHTRYGDPVYKDSCVEFFVRPEGNRGYFNFEFNCGGAMLASYITDHERTPDGFREFVRLTEEDAGNVSVFHSLPRRIDEELTGPTVWLLEFFIPFSLLQQYAGNLGIVVGRTWRANFFKCGDETSHPHWLSWRPVPVLNFHLPECFGAIRFGER